MLNFICIGAQKAGTTWLFDKLKMHPNVYFPLGKEVNFWNNKFYNSPLFKEIYHASMNGPVVDMGDYICGEITPEYVLMDEKQIKVLKKHHPNIKIILMVRNPVERAWSAIKMTFNYMKLDLSELDNNKRIINGITSGLTYEMGLYGNILKKWKSYYSEEQIKVVFFDDFIKKSKPVISEVCQFLDLDDSFFYDIPDSILDKPSLQGMKKKIDKNVYNTCIKAYANDLNSFQKDTRKDLSHWLSER